MNRSLLAVLFVLQLVAPVHGQSPARRAKPLTPMPESIINAHLLDIMKPVRIASCRQQ
jgi:hypothetical protein